MVSATARSPRSTKYDRRGRNRTEIGPRGPLGRRSKRRARSRSPLGAHGLRELIAHAGGEHPLRAALAGVRAQDDHEDITPQLRKSAHVLDRSTLSRTGLCAFVRMAPQSVCAARRSGHAVDRNVEVAQPIWLIGFFARDRQSFRVAVTSRASNEGKASVKFSKHF